jgi:hypothetical protein
MRLIVNRYHEYGIFGSAGFGLAGRTVFYLHVFAVFSWNVGYGVSQ